MSDKFIYEGGESSLESLKAILEPWVMLLALVVVLLIAVIVYLMFVKKESFNPTRTMGFQERDGTGERFAKRREHLDAAAPPQSAFAAQGDRYGDGSSAGIVSAVGASTVLANGASLSPAAAEVLASDDFACSTRTSVGDDAWGWMAGVAGTETFSSRPKNDNDFSRIITGN